MRPDPGVECGVGNAWSIGSGIVAAVISIAMLALAFGCAKTPRYIVCTGKANMTADAHISAGYGGANRVSLTGDCGEGFMYYHGDKPLAPDQIPIK